MERGKLTLYVAGAEATRGPLVEGLRKAVAARADVDPRLEVVDLLGDAGRARAAQVLVAPTLVLEAPQGTARAFGDLSDPREALWSLGLEA